MWVNKQSSQLHRYMTSLQTEQLSPLVRGEVAASPALFSKQDVGRLHHLLLLLQLTYVPNPLNGSGMRAEGGLSGRQSRPKQLDDFDGDYCVWC